ncbi:MAG: Leucyl/phenylalanyl-tRNA--protein transferase [Pseudomonadota bacterium]|jgi:leucyl/phenylalanyl-tRNA--protein transferase
MPGMPKDLSSPPLPWLDAGDDFPAAELAWPADSAAPGLLAAGSTLNADLVQRAYQRGIFPWFSPGQPVLWWSPDPRMVLRPADFRLRRSLRQSLKQWMARDKVALVFDRDFAQVMRQCAQAPRAGQHGTWIVPSMIEVYTQLHRQGLAHSAELWQGGQLLAGLYFVALGRAVYGESMFTTVRDGSKLALCLLVSVARRHGVPLIDCQQNTAHLASLGAREVPRAAFLDSVAQAQGLPAIDWANEGLYWDELPP